MAINWYGRDYVGKTEGCVVPDGHHSALECPRPQTTTRVITASRRGTPPYVPFSCPETLRIFPETFSSHSTRLYQSVFTPTTHSFSSQVLELRRQSPSVGRSTVSSRWWNTPQPFLLLLPPVLTYPYAPIPGHVRKTEAGKNLKRWKAEKWKNTRTGRACGNSKDSGEYCRPSKRVSSKTPKMRPRNASANKALKARGLRAKRAT